MNSVLILRKMVLVLCFKKNDFYYYYYQKNHLNIPLKMFQVALEKNKNVISNFILFRSYCALP